MTRERIGLASDHAGFALKAVLRQRLVEWGFEVLDLGTDSEERVDYPEFGDKLARAVADGEVARGVVVCGTGVGISIAANRHPGVRAALCHDVTGARLSRQHNDANVLALGQRMIGQAVAVDCLRAFLDAEFEGGRHGSRVAKLG